MEDVFIETSVTDGNFNKTLYDTDSATGLLKPSTNAKGIIRIMIEGRLLRLKAV